MPFKSKAQLRTCFSKRDPRWNCKQWVHETQSICNLPERVGQPKKSRTKRRGEKIIGKIQTGPRGGRFFVIKEKDKNGIICEMKIYVK